MEISANKPEFRRVRTAEGAAYYGLPIGSLIKPSAAKKIFKAKAWNDPAPVSTGVAFNEYLGQPGAEGDEGPEALSGPQAFAVGDEYYSAPKGSRLFSVEGGPEIKYVLTPDGHVTPFTPDAQINLVPALGKSLRGILTDPKKLASSKYKEETFTTLGLAVPEGPVNAADLPLGTKVVSRNGDYSLVKGDEGWSYDAFGIEVDDETVQALMDKGDLVVQEEAAPEPEPTPEPEPEVAPEANALPSPAEEEAAAVEAEADLPPVYDEAPLDFSTMDKEQFLAILDGMPAGTSLYAKSASAPKGYVTYQKSPTDSKWLADSGSVYSPNAMAYISKGLTTEPPVDTTPEPEPLKPLFAAPLPISQPKTLEQVAPKMAEKIKFKQPTAPKGATEPFNTAVDAPLAAPEPVSAAAALNLQEEEQDAAGDIQVIPAGKMIPKADVVAAIEGLEGHSGFQVAYGLKGLPEGNPFKDVGFQNQIKDYASEQFPDLKPKPAFVAYLKAKAGIATATEAKDTGVKDINIGSASPKQVGVQGYDGGVFSEQEIQEAITLLEGFEGKAFKAYLNKNGNALGVLDPTKIVGFNKDKTVMKKDFIALLKKKVPSADVAPISTEEIQAVEESFAEPNDGQIVPMVENESVAPLTKPTLEMLEKVGDGSSMVVTWDGEDHDFEKVNDQWVMEGSTKPLVDKSFHTLLNSEGTTVSEINLFPKAAAPEIKTEGTFTEADIESSPVGTHVEVFDMDEGQSHILHKTPEGWKFKESTNDQPMDEVYDDEDMKAYLYQTAQTTVFGFGKPDSDFVKTAKPGKPAPPSAEPTPIEAAVVAPTVDEFNPTLLDLMAAPKWKAVLQVTDTNGKITYWVKNDKGEWLEALDAGGEPIDAGHYGGPDSAAMWKTATAPGSGAYLTTANPEASKPVYAQQAPAALKVNGPAPDKFKSGEADPYEVNHAPVGTTLLLQVESNSPDNNGADYVLTKTTDEMWTVVKSSDGFFAVGDQWSNAQVKSSLIHGKSTSGYWVDLSLVEQGGPAADGPQEITKDNVPNLAFGTTLVMVDTTAPPAIYTIEVTKVSNGSWTVSQTSNPNVFPQDDEWSDADVEGMIGTAGVTVEEKGHTTTAPNSVVAGDLPGLTVGSQISLHIKDNDSDAALLYELEKSSDTEWVITASENKYVPPGTTWTAAKVTNWLAGNIGNHNTTAYLISTGQVTGKVLKGNKEGYGSGGHLATLHGDPDAVVKIYPSEGAPITAMPSGNGASAWVVLQGSDSKKMSSDELSAIMKGEEGWVVYKGETITSPANSESVTPDKSAPAVTNGTGLEPGKYVSGGKAYMIVKADGKGLYVDSKGDVTSLTTAKVKSNYAAGMNTHEPLPDVIPSVTPVKVKKVATVEKIEDGTYFSGDPNDVKTPVYTVANGEVTVTKPKSSTEGSTTKVGSKTQQVWVDLASPGAKVKVFTDVYVMTGEAGKGNEKASWVHAVTGAEVTPYHWDKIRPNYAYYSGSATILSHGSQAPVTVPLAKAKTLFATGKLMDMYGNSVVPEGYSGSVFFYGSQTTMPALFKAKQHLELDPETFSQTTISELTLMGVKVNPALLKKKTEADAGGADNVEKNGKGIGYHKTVMATLESFLDGVEVEEPEGDAKEFFTFNSQAEAKFPSVLATMQPGSKPEKNAWIKAASLAVGDGAIIGLNPTKMADYEADQWISYFRQGNFKALYTLDVNAAGKPGAKPLLEGYKHPGSPENEETHLIAWQPAVEGEISALKDVEGNWTSLNVQASLAEIDNYLIKAQMQNPTHLSNAEKRMWVTRHRQNNKPAVDQLSVLAEQRKQQGIVPATEPPTWNDDVKPAKSYDSLFDDTIHPTDSWTQAKALDYYNDTKDTNPDLVKAYEAATGYNDGYKAQNALVSYFSEEKEKAYQLSLIPVYTKKPIQTVKQGTHPISQWTDQWGNEYFYKPRPKGMEFRADIEMLGNSLGRFWGYDSAKPQIIGLDGFEYGLLMKGVPAVGDLMNFDLSTLTGAQVGDLASEHVLDWMLDNDDTKGDNALITPDGKIIGIDKGRTFFGYGHWDALTSGQSMNTNANVVYGQMLRDIEAGKISKATADEAYLKMQKRIKRIQKSSDADIATMVTGAMEHRDKGYKVPYKIDGKLVSQDLDGLLAAIEDRKSKLDTDFATLWTKVYKKAGYGDLPEIPDKHIDGIISGFDDPDLAPEIIKAQAHSKTLMIAGAHSHAGDVQVWTDKGTDGSDNVEGRMFLSFRAQDKILNTLKGLSTNEPTPSQQVESGAFPTNLDTFWDSFFQAAKTVNHHSADGEYNADKIDAWKVKSTALNADLLAWSPDLKATTISGVEYVAFPSGNQVPRSHLGQYRLMLEHYVTQSNAIQKGLDEKAKIIPHIEQYKPFTVQPKDYYSNETGHAIRLGLGNNWLITDFKSGKVEQHADDSLVMAAIKSGSGGWVKYAEVVPEKPAAKPYTVTLMNKTHEKPANLVDGVKTTTGNGHVGTGAQGSEYKIQLATGETIYYRNYGQTSTVRSQNGMLSFRAEGVGKDDAGMSTAFEHIQAVLGELGISTDAAEEHDAENIYWREMYDLFTQRNSYGRTAKHTAVLATFDAKRKEILKGADEKYFLEDLSLSFESAEAEAQWWRKTYSDAFGADVIDKVVSDRAYLPKYDHYNMEDHEQETGHPYWIRFDVTLEEIRATGKILGSTSSKEPVYKVKSGGNLGAEERFRLTGQWNNGMSATSDQTHGSAHNVYTRVNGFDGGSYSGYRTFYDPAAMLRTRAYSFDSDNFGELNNRKGSSPTNPAYALKNFTSGGNETLLPHGTSLMDTIEVYVFEKETARQEAIDFLKKRGIEIIRGLPVEDRMVMRSNLSNALKKVKASWQTA